MAGKANKAKNRGKSLNRTATESSESLPSKEVSVSLDSGNRDVPEANGAADSKAENYEEVTTIAPEATPTTAEAESRLYPVPVKTPSGEKLELQLNSEDSVMDIRQFLLDAPETCFYTCYDLVLHASDGSPHQLGDYSKISEVADISTGGCSIEMFGVLYDDRSIRSHVRRSRDLISLSNYHSSLSTSLSLQHEHSQQKSSDAVKVDTPELDALGFMEDVSCSVCNFVVSSPMDIKCVESITFSSFNPPPSYRRLVGDLIYVDIKILEGTELCISGTTKGFYVNSSTGNIFDPKLAKTAHEASTLVGLLQKISPKFKKGFREVLERKASGHPFENVQSLLPPNAWLGVHPIPDHSRDAARAEDALVLSYGSEIIGMQRDWNEELQSCREFPHKSLQERILRDRALYKVTCDFVDAATNGAIGVINRCIPPINPTDPECFHMYVHNNIFFSFAVDADLGFISKDQMPSGDFNLSEDQDDTKTSSNTVTENCGDAFHGKCKELSSTATSTSTGTQTVSDGKSVAGAETQIAESEQATYASANNDLKGTKAYQEADVPGLFNLAMAIIDFRGHRVVGQSIIPGILQGDKSDSLLYGSVDNGKKICWNESFHSKVLEAAKLLHLKEHTVLDGSGNAIRLAAPVECKGIVGSDDRHYLLDLMRVTPRDVNYNGPGSRFCVLRPELISSFCEVESGEQLASQSKHEVEQRDSLSNHEAPPSSDSPSLDDKENLKEEVEDDRNTASVTAESSQAWKEICLNPNVFTEFKMAGTDKEIATDEALVRRAGSYLVDTVLPKFVEDLCSLEVSPMDGQTLTEALHAHGINVRYLGKVANMMKHLPHIWDLCTTEIIVRSTKHILKDELRETQDHDLSPTISHIFNCLFGHVSMEAKSSASSPQLKAQKKDQAHHHSSKKSGKGQMKWNHGPFSRKVHSSQTHLHSEGVWSSIQEFAKFKYQFELPDDARLRVKKISVIRNLCQKIGITIAARRYDLNSDSPFQTLDILNLLPVIKHSVPLCLEAKNLIEIGKARLSEGTLNEAYTLFSEAFSVLQQVTGPMHREVANCCRYLAMVLYHAGDMKGAITQQHKELIINERCLGLDHPDTAHSYGNMALFYHGLNQTQLALKHMSRTLLLLGLSAGPDHPDVAATFINIAMMYQDLGNLRYLQEALKKNERLLGSDHIQTAVCYHALAIAFNCMGAYKLSIQHEKKTYDILVKQLGEDDSRARDSDNWIKTFKMREAQANAQKQKGQAVNASSAQKAIDILKANPNLIQAFQAAGGVNNLSMDRSINAALVGEGFPRGRGVDERAARAAAEVRKKAAAKGLLGRPNGTPVQTIPWNQFLTILNNSTASETEPNSQSNEPNKSNGATEGEKASQTPAGLGTGLASLNSKKQKQKAK
ncbi:clustered mitochondria protein isoform X2 [Phalaenopsis equestris]|uniref:clustered mitochondria protein isoform X2 n=1 Tax=Phalaenopsis equestris TaxID=78828 RepID=UPI0009E2585A|nr:clustered mitochondria protein isoform X2 [Phalaenopsis equestris]